jgi:hypothetical protein
VQEAPKVEHQVLGFYVAVDDFVGVNVLQRQNDAADEELRLKLREKSLFVTRYVKSQVAAW